MRMIMRRRWRQLDKNIAAGEGNKLQNLKQALSVAITAKSKEKTDQYAKDLGGNLDNETRLFIASFEDECGSVEGIAGIRKTGP